MWFHRRIEWHSEAGSKLCYRSTNVWGDDRWRKPQVSTKIIIIITLCVIKNHESQLLPLLGPFHKYSAAQIVQGGKKFQARNETAESFFQCAAKCNAAFLVNAKWVNWLFIAQLHQHLAIRGLWQWKRCYKSIRDRGKPGALVISGEQKFLLHTIVSSYPIGTSFLPPIKIFWQ